MTPTDTLAEQLDELKDLIETAAQLSPRDRLRAEPFFTRALDTAALAKSQQSRASWVLAAQLDQIRFILAAIEVHPSRSETGDTQRCTPPRGARKMLRLIPDKTVRRTTIGDLEEEFPLLVQEQGIRFARRWYKWQACCMTGTYIVRQLRKALVPAAMLERLIRALLK